MLKRAGALLAGVAVLPVAVPGIAVAQSNGSAPQSIPDLRFNLPPKPTPTPAPPPSGPIVAPFSRPTPTPTAAATPASRAPVTPPPVAITQPGPTPAVPAPRPTPRAAAPAPQGRPTPLPTAAAATPTIEASPPPAVAPTPEATPGTAPAATPAAPAEQPSGGWSSSTWVAIGVALVALAAAGWFLLGRRRLVEEEDWKAVSPQPAPAAPPPPIPAATPVAPPAPAPVPAAPSGLLTVPLRRIVEGMQPQPVPQPPSPPLPAGLVTVRAPQPPRGASLEEQQPELEIVLIPQRAGTDPSMSAAIEYRIVVRNTGRGDARDVAFGIYMLSSSARQAADLQMIFASPVEKPVVAPFTIRAGDQIELTGTALLPRANLNVMTIDGKPWFVPVLAMKAEYRWGENVGTPGVATAAHMIGINRGEGAKLAPFRLDGEPRMHPQVAERRVA